MDRPKPVPQSARVPQRSCRHDWTPRCARPTTPAISAVVPRHRPPLPSLRHIRAPTLLRSRLAIRRRSGACGRIVRCDGHDANTAALPGSILTSFASLPGDAPRSRMPHHPNGQQDSARQGERRSGASVKLRGVLATGSISPTDETKQRQFHEQTHAANVPSGMKDSEHFNAVLDRLIQGEISTDAKRTNLLLQVGPDFTKQRIAGVQFGFPIESVVEPACGRHVMPSEPVADRPPRAVSIQLVARAAS